MQPDLWPGRSRARSALRSPPHESRGFVHKKLIRAAVGFIPGGSLALQGFDVARSLTGGGRAQQLPVRTVAAPVRRPSCATDSDFRALVATRSWAEVASICGTTVAAAQARFRPAAARAAPRAAAPSCATDAAFRSLVATKPWSEVARICGTTVAAAQARFRPPTSSIPPRNPVREAVIRAKPLTDIVRLPSPIRSRIPVVVPVQQPHPIGATMPLHKPFLRHLIGSGPQCPPGAFPGPGGVCIDPSAILPGGDRFIGAGAPVMVLYGAAYEGTSRLIQRTTCLSGDLVGDDGLCYNRKSLTNKERMWPRGRQPLLTGGEMRAISIASRAAGKFERTQKRLQKIGMIKKPASRSRAPKLPPHQHQITSGG